MVSRLKCIYQNFKEKSVQEKVFINILCLSIFLPIVLIAQIIIYSYPIINIITWLVLLLTSSVVLYIYVNIKNHNLIHLIYYSVCIFILLPFGWTLSALESPFPLAFAFIALIAVCNFFENKTRIFFVLGIIGVMITLLFLQ